MKNKKIDGQKLIETLIRLFELQENIKINYRLERRVNNERRNAYLIS